MDMKLNSTVRVLCDMTTVSYFQTANHVYFSISFFTTCQQDQLIKYYGFEVDSYNVSTEDGYILSVFRCYSNEFPMNELEPILLQHGMMDSSDAFCLNPGIQSLGSKLV